MSGFWRGVYAMSVLVGVTVAEFVVTAVCGRGPRPA